ncbi:MAG: DNA translocase FtsK 4TM domain-containing protein [Bacteroidales bacterium]|nr:DNA translocase FtsK 4TM domain-containing protein [Bacteroidales bacterium]
MLKNESKKKGSGKKKTDNGFVNFLKSEAFRKICGVFLLLFSVFLAVVFVSYFFSWSHDRGLSEGQEYANLGGKIGFKLANFFIYRTFGMASMGYIVLFMSLAFKLLNINALKCVRTSTVTIFWMVWVSLFFGFVHLFTESTPDNIGWIGILAGVAGYSIAVWIQGLLGKIGLVIILFFSLMLGLWLIHHVSFKGIVTKINAQLDKMNADKVEKPDNHDEKPEQQQARVERTVEPKEEENNTLVTFEHPKGTIELSPEEPELERETAPTSENSAQFEILDPIPSDEIIEENIEDSDVPVEHYTIDEPYDPRLDLRDYQFPNTDMLEHHEERNVEVTREEMIANNDKIVKTLKSYSIEITKITASPGPTVTLYEIVPASGIRISKIKVLEDDIALSLSALGIRIIAPIPGKGTIGIEVPNAKPQVVSMLTMINSDKFQNNNYELPIAIGKTVSNETYVTDLTKMPHLLMAGATGQGKSVGLNAIIASLLYKKHPSELKFIMVDPKKVELSLYNPIERHYLAKLPDSEEAIITDVRKVVRTLNSLCIEMDNRYDLLKDAQVRNIKEYNPKFIARRLNPEREVSPNNYHRYLPYIVVVVDEFADLIMTAGREVEQPIARIAQLARAVGIHLIIATQRPSVKIITGTIKANFPARIAFRVTSGVDSRTILDGGGAERLIGRGDMLLSSGSDILRLQCALIDTPEIQKIVDFIGAQRGYPDCFLLPEYLDENDAPNKDFDVGKKDEFFEEAARLVVASQHGSTSLLQRKLSLGYNRAGKIIDQLEAAGIVGPFEGSKAREVLVKTEADLEVLLRNLRESGN